MKIPSRIKIGSQFFKVIERSRQEDGMLSDNTYGYTLDMENLIVIDAKIALSRKKLTLFHELMHATRMVYDTSITPKKSDNLDVWEHYFIGIWEESLLVLMRDNPTLLSWLLEEELETNDNNAGSPIHKAEAQSRTTPRANGGSRESKAK
jgi:hypothetical protein